MMYRQSVVMICVLAALQATGVRADSAPDRALRPNIIHIMADDLGYDEIGSFGQSLIRTPHLDQLASEGMRFTQYYSGSALCNPSRFALVTGKHSGTTGITTNAANNLPSGGYTLGRMLQAEGYYTGIIGKWALGEIGSGGEPLEQGFDYFFGFENQNAAHNYYPQTLTENGNKVILSGNKDSDKRYIAEQRNTYAPAVMQQRALAFIEQNKERRFYLQLDYTLPHVNNELLAATGNGNEHPGVGRYANESWSARERDYAEMVSVLDDYVGELIAKLRTLGIAESTLVIFTSDNGPIAERTFGARLRFSYVGKLRGWKGHLFEGGIRVPMIAWWPGTIPAGSRSDSAYALWDVMPTLAELVGSDAEFETDGLSFAGVLRGKADKPVDRLMYWELLNRKAVRYGDWKWVRVGENSPLEEDFLFNIRLDPSERFDLSIFYQKNYCDCKTWRRYTRERIDQVHPNNACCRAV